LLWHDNPALDERGTFMTIEETIKNFVTTNFILEENPAPIDNDQSFLESGIIDSTGMLELVSFIEEQFGIKIEDEELIPANLDSVNNVVKFLEQKLGDRVQG
jgi:acyl carrier protein